MGQLQLHSPVERTIHHLLERRATLQGEAVFFWFKEQSFSYARLNRMASGVAKGLQETGVAKGDRVAVMLGNSAEFLAVWFGLSKLGAIEVALNTAHRGYLLSYQLNQAQCSVLIVDQGFLPCIEGIRKELESLRHVIVLGAEGELPVWPGIELHRYEEVTGKGEDYRPVEVLWNDPLGIMFTSGTTGPSKGAVLPQNYAIHTAEIISGIAGYGPEDCLYNALPLFHGNAKLLSTMPALYAGATMVLAERFSASQFWEDVARYRCTEFNYIGSILSILLKADPKPDDRANSLRVLLGAGATPGVYEAFEARFGVSLIEGYGMSEIGLPLMSRPGASKPGTCGKPHPDYEVKLVDDQGQAVATGVPGELLVRPKKPWSTLLEYYRMPEKTVEAWQGLWFHTGDYLLQDEEGFYHFVDRKKDAIRRRGENISSYEVETMVTSHPLVLEAAATPVKSELGEDEVMITVVLRPGAQLSAAELIVHCEQVMAKFMVPRYVRFVASLPRTPTEKVQKYVIREQGVTADTWDRERQDVGSAPPARQGVAV
ncbi:AMP-binding protein [Dechloromonas sp. A34]|uniref:AMP-binding protein n=1 Tax=Dechloromonas sp. A34 TaxID=447588 RepID=UPI002248A445|nr:AMP-binding protein [Dechloromonas sp. A34]